MERVNGYSMPYGMTISNNQAFYDPKGFSQGLSQGLTMGATMGRSMGATMGRSMGRSMGLSMGASMGASMGSNCGIVPPIIKTGGPEGGFTSVNLPFGSCLLKSDAYNRQGIPGTDIFGNGVDYSQCVPLVIKPASVIGPQNTYTVNKLDQNFLAGNYAPVGISAYWKENFAGPDLQSERPKETAANSYINLASNSLHAAPDDIMKSFFSDANIKHLRDSITSNVKKITTNVVDSGVDIKPPNMDDLFYYMVNSFQNYKINNGSICFVNIKNGSDTQKELYKLNTDVLQDYTSKMVSQINMYVYYYKDASQLPEQLSLPTYNSMKGSRTLEYNTGFKSGNSQAIASYNESTNIF